MLKDNLLSSGMQKAVGLLHGTDHRLGASKAMGVMTWLICGNPQNGRVEKARGQEGSMQ